MNWIANTHKLVILSLACCIGSLAPAADAVSDDKSLAYVVRYQIAPTPDEHRVSVSMTVEQDQELLREVRFRNDSHISAIRVDGKAMETGDEIVWQPGPAGGTLQWLVELGIERNGNGYDAWLNADWGVFRAEDVIPRAATRAARGATSKTSMAFDLPDNWAVVTAYPEEDKIFTIDKDYRRFDQPDGWIAIGRLGVRRETIAGVQVAVAGPVGHSVRRMEILAVLNWTLPELARALADLPPRLTIISAGEPMWRGGLSGPNSLYLHAERPLISENATSPLLHEVMHSVLRLSTAEGYDWLVEGIAEYYSLELLRRSGTISEPRHQKAMKFQKNWSASADTLCKSSSSGATTALAVTIMSALDAEIRDRSSGDVSLDDVLATLQQNPKGLTLADVQSVVTDLIGAESVTLQLDKLPGCRSIQPIVPETS